jgi:hypothetical protein
MDNKKIPTSVGTIVLVIIAITVGAFVWRIEKNNSKETPLSQNFAKTDSYTEPKKQAENQPSEKNEENTEVLVKPGSVYKNDTYGFTLKIPQGVATSRISNADVVLAGEPGGHWIYDIRIADNINNQSLQDVLSKILADRTDSSEVKTSVVTNNIKIDGKPAESFTIKNYGDYGNAGAVLINGNKIFAIYGDDANKEGLDIILGSFHFAK